MQTNPPDPESVAAGLTKAQREVIRRLSRKWLPDDCDTAHLRRIWTDEAMGLRPDFVEYCREGVPTYGRPKYRHLHRLTPLGLTVRAAIQSKETK
jgi:hypothetical protein